MHQIRHPVQPYVCVRLSTSGLPTTASRRKRTYCREGARQECFAPDILRPTLPPHPITGRRSHGDRRRPPRRRQSPAFPRPVKPFSHGCRHPVPKMPRAFTSVLRCALTDLPHAYTQQLRGVRRKVGGPGSTGAERASPRQSLGAPAPRRPATPRPRERTADRRPTQGHPPTVHTSSTTSRQQLEPVGPSQNTHPNPATFPQVTAPRPTRPNVQATPPRVPKLAGYSWLRAPVEGTRVPQVRLGWASRPGASRPRRRIRANTGAPRPLRQGERGSLWIST